jgi:cytochrome c
MMKSTHVALAVAQMACVAVAAWVEPALAQEDIAKKAGCTTCHALDKKLIGPSFNAIAAKYKADPGAVAKLSNQVRKGSRNIWGPMPMPPAGPAKISDGSGGTAFLNSDSRKLSGELRHGLQRG